MGEIHEQMRNQLIDICLSGKNQNAISKALGLQWTMQIERARNSGEPSQERQIYQKETPKEQWRAAKALQASMSKLRSVFMIQQEGKWAEIASMLDFWRQKQHRDLTHIHQNKKTFCCSSRSQWW